MCVCVPTIKQINVALEHGLRRFIEWREREREEQGDENTAQRGAVWFVLCSEWWWVVNWKGVGELGKEKFTGEIRNTHKISVRKLERKRRFGRSRPRWNVKNNVIKCTERITIPIAFRSVKYKFFLRIISSVNGTKMWMGIKIL